MLKGAILGFGAVAEAAHAPAFLERSDMFKIEAVADAAEKRREAARRLFPGIRAYARAEELLSKEIGIDFVDIATPPALHANLALLSLQYRRHVLVEKPLALHLKDLASLKAQARAQRVSLFTVHNWKYAPLFVKLAEVIEEGSLGELRHLELHTLRSKPAAGNGAWRADGDSGGLLVDHGWHAFYLLRHLIGADPKQVACRVKRAGAGLDEVTILVEAGDANAMIYLTWGAAFRSNWGILYGGCGTAEIRDDQLIVRVQRGAEKIFKFKPKLSTGSAHPDWFSAMLPEFLAEIQNPQRRGRNLAEAETCLRLVYHAQQSHRMGGKSIPLPVMPDIAAPVRTA